MATDRLYYRDAYLGEFRSHVTRRADDGRRLYLDRTAMYPTSGGQPHDLGTINGVPVLDVIDEGDDVAHVLSSKVDADDVDGIVDWGRRYDFMQQHTGQHLISAVFADTFGYGTVSVHFGDTMSTIDLQTPTVDVAQLRRAEELANAVIAQNREVHVTFEEQASATGLRKASEREGVIRVVEIAGIDRSACGGTHVRSTAEIGVLLLRRQERVRSTARIEFVCGVRAARRARSDFEALSALGQALSASLDDIPALVLAQQQSLKAAEQKNKRMDGELAEYRARETYRATSPGEAGIYRYVHVATTGSLEDHRSFAIAFSLLPKAACVIGHEATRSVLIAASDSSGVDAGAMMKQAAAALGGRGGGSARLAQGSFPDSNAFARAVQMLGA
ncbi:MAG: alanyl-tRNA editing protein [Gemmatimonadaceae bacterium]